MRNEDILKTVELLNDDVAETVYEKNPNLEIETLFEEGYLSLELRTVGLSSVIMFLGIPIWQSECDGRLYEADDEQESLETYLRREIDKLLLHLSKFQPFPTH